MMKRLHLNSQGNVEISHGTNLLKSFSSASLGSAKGWSQAPGKGGDSTWERDTHTNLQEKLGRRKCQGKIPACRI